MFGLDEYRSKTFLVGDLLGLLRGIARAGDGPRGPGAYAAGYSDGFRAAIEAVAYAVGIPTDSRRDEGQRIPVKHRR